MPLRAWRSSRHPIARRQRLEVLIGFLGFWTLVAFVVAVVAELRGEPAITEALLLACAVAVLGLAVRARRRV